MTETKSEFKIPVAFIIFNRPEKTARVFDRIRRIEPSELYIIADGPRPEIPADEAACMETRNVVDEVDWDCTVHRNYAKTNMGCFERIYTGIDWVFETAEQAIILEGDCLPHHSFFRFCERMLQEYRNDERVMDISGSNPLGTWKDNRQDYHFSYPRRLRIYMCRSMLVCTVSTPRLSVWAVSLAAHHKRLNSTIGSHTSLNSR